MSREFVCKDCRHLGVPQGYGKLRGNFIVSTILWTFVIPGIIYSIWRRTGRGSCARCGSTALTSLDSSYGKIALEEYYIKEFSKTPPKTKI